MDRLTNKRAESFDYTSRYTGVPYYYDKVANRDVYGIGQQIDFNTAYLSHSVRPGDTLDSLALVYYNNPTFWWAIAYFNKINDPFINLATKYRVIRIPAIASVVFENARR